MKQPMVNNLTKEQVADFLWKLQWTRTTKKELEKQLTDFFGVPMELEDATDDEFKEVDYSFITTTAQEQCATHNFIDIEIYYLKMRQRGWFVITGSEILDFVE